jgi:predicted nicotinamide N-methyase
MATDASPDAVVFAAHNLALNDLEGEVAQVDWSEADALVGGAPWDLVIAADVLYRRQNVESLLRLLPRLLGAAGEAIVADPHRAGGRDFLASARSVFRLAPGGGAQSGEVALHRLRPRA